MVEQTLFFTDGCSVLLVLALLDSGRSCTGFQCNALYACLPQVAREVLIVLEAARVLFDGFMSADLAPRGEGAHPSVGDQAIFSRLTSKLSVLELSIAYHMSSRLTRRRVRRPPRIPFGGVIESLGSVFFATW